MATALFFGLPVQGHTNPTLPLVAELVRRGEAITYYSTDAYAAAIAATGATYRPYRNAFLPELGAAARQVHELAWLFMRTTAELLETELESYRAERPDYVITDSVASWGQWIGALVGVPIVTSVSTFAFNRHVLRYGARQGVRPKSGGQFLSKLGHLARALGLRRQLQRRYRTQGPSLMATMSGHSALTLVYTSREIQPCAETFDDRYRFVGPLLAPRVGDMPFPWERVRHPTIVYVSLGTLFNVNAAFYRQCFDAFDGAGFTVILSVGATVPIDSLGSPPSNVLVFARVPQLEILARASAFVTHGGMNGVSESLSQAVPMLVIPQMGEQEIVGRRIAELGAAICVHPDDVTAGRLRADVDRLLEEDGFRAAASGLQASLRAAGGVKAAADAVLRFTQEPGRAGVPAPAETA